MEKIAVWWNIDIFFSSLASEWCRWTDPTVVVYGWVITVLVIFIHHFFERSSTADAHFERFIFQSSRWDRWEKKYFMKSHFARELHISGEMKIISFKETHGQNKIEIILSCLLNSTYQSFFESWEYSKFFMHVEIWAIETYCYGRES